MTRSVSLRPPAEVTLPPPLELSRDGLTWWCEPTWKRLIESSLVSWPDLRDRPGVTRVKRNGHRDVWRVEAGGETLFVKRYRLETLAMRLKVMFRGPAACREWHVGHYAARYGISAITTVACGWSGSRWRPGLSLLISRGVPGAVPLSDYWLTVRHDTLRSRAICEQVARLVARAHQGGFRHHDMHAGNILIQTEQCASPTAIFVDLHNVRIDHTVGPREIVANLSQLNQWFRRNATRAQRLRFLRAYLAARDEFAQSSPHARNWTIDPRELLAALAASARLHAERIWSKRDRRSMRNGKYFGRFRVPGGWRCQVLLECKHPRPHAPVTSIVFERRQWRQWLDDPTAWTDPDEQTVLKDSHSGLVCQATLDLDAAGTDARQLRIVCKRPRPRTALKRLLYAVGPSRNLRAWRRANKLIHRDLPAVQPLAVAERYWAGLFRCDSILMTEMVENAVDVEAFLLRDVLRRKPEERRRMKNKMIDAVVHLVRDMADRGFVHRDFKAANLLIRWSEPFDNLPLLTLIDMDGIRHRGGAQIAAADRAVVRLNVSLLDCPVLTRTDRLRFLRAYLLTTRRRTSDWKSWWRRMADESKSKWLTKERRRLWKLQHYGRE